MDRKTRNHCPRSKQHLWELLQNSWENIPIEKLQQLVSRMPKLSSYFSFLSRLPEKGEKVEKERQSWKRRQKIEK
ncbi:hypothetical protein ANTRET_LOCUS3768 [Anthophora retusa]